MQKILLIIAIIVLHLLWIFSVRRYYETTYKKYLETRKDFDWAFIFKKKELPYTEYYHIFFNGEKIGSLQRTYSQRNKFFYITTTAEINKLEINLFSHTLKLPDGVNLSSEISLTPLFDIKSIEIFLSTPQKCYLKKLLSCRYTYNTLISLFAERRGEKLKLKIDSEFLPANKIDIEVDEKYLQGSLGHGLLLFGSRPAVGKSWTVSLGTFGEINAVVDEKFVKEDEKGSKIVIYSVSYHSSHFNITGYSWITEEGELLKLVLYKPNITIVKRGLRF